MPYNPKPIRIYEAGGTFPDIELGRYDSRIAVPSSTVWAADGDPSSTLLNQPYTDQIKMVLDSSFKYVAKSPYSIRADDEWTYSHKINGVDATTPIVKDNYIDTIPDIKIALALNPKMKIMAASGFHDLATPFHLTKFDLDRLSESERKNLVIKNYEGGHMMYLTHTSRKLLKADMEKFYQAQAQ